MMNQMKLFGEKVGIAFQIKDDLFDYAPDDVGKPTGNDIKEKKLTLPLIYTLNTIDKKTRKEIIYIIKNENTRKAKISYIVDEVIKAGGIDYTVQKMNEWGTSLIGSPQTVIAKAREMIAIARPDTLVGMFSFGGLQHQQVMRSIENFGTKVIPALGM